ncbi:hypothetical protein [Pedobacter antarcticus]|nr:hypothetical protein [Pedobacter antarcticus]
MRTIFRQAGGRMKNTHNESWDLRFESYELSAGGRKIKSEK